jgi:hypothetical protein
MAGELTLYEITDTLPALLDSLDMTEPGSPERAECEADIARYMEALPTKVDGVGHVRASLKGMSALAAEEIKRLQMRKQRFDAALERIDGYVVSILEGLPEPKRGPKKLEGATTTLSLAKCPPSLRIFSEAMIPAEYRVVVPATTEVNKAAVKDALKLGIAVPGAELVTDKHRLAVR